MDGTEREWAVRRLRARIVERFEARTQSDTAGAHDVLIEAILEELLAVLPDAIAPPAS
jgi:hypothetical protein